MVFHGPPPRHRICPNASCLLRSSREVTRRCLRSPFLPLARVLGCGYSSLWFVPSYPQQGRGANMPSVQRRPFRCIRRLPQGR